MKSFFLAALVIATATFTAAAATPTSTKTAAPTSSNCVTNAQATALIDNWVAILTNNVTNPEVQAGNLLVGNFTYQSDSSLAVVGAPAGVIISRAQYIGGLAEIPANLTIKTLAIGNDCHDILWFYEANLGTGQHPIRGFQLLENIVNGTISNIFEEFNSIAWGEDIGGTYTAPSPNPE